MIGRRQILVGGLHLAVGAALPCAKLLSATPAPAPAPAPLSLAHQHAMDIERAILFGMRVTKYSTRFGQIVVKDK